MKKLIYIAIFAAFYMLFNELEDKSIKDNWNVHETYLNTSESWKNKYELTETGNLIPYESQWYHFGIEPAYKERFPYSTTLFVFLTDGEHLFQFLKNISIVIGLLFVGWRIALAWLIGSKIGSVLKEILKFD